MRSEENRKEIRQRVRAARRAVAEPTRVGWSARIGERVGALGSFQQAQKIAGFLAFDGEADPLDLMTHAVNAGKQVFVPMIVAKSKPLKFAAWSPTGGLEPNRFGILEPDVPKSEWIEARELDFVITPLVAFDKSCNRIGVGAGFYDRSFAFLRESPGQTPLVGFAFELQKLRSIKSSQWDVPLTAVATEIGLYHAETS